MSSNDSQALRVRHRRIVVVTPVTFIANSPFLPLHPKPYKPNLIRPRPAIWRHSVRAQAPRPSKTNQTPSVIEPRSTSNIDTNTNTPDDAIQKRPAPFLDPKGMPALFRSPESVLTFAALGILSAGAVIASLARRFTADVANRARLILAARSVRLRLVARVRERAFLQSAVEATSATLANTQSMLDAQTERAAIAELRLGELNKQRDDLSEVESRRQTLVDQLAEAEDRLRERRVSFSGDGKVLEQLRDDVQLCRDGIAEYDEQCRKAIGHLEQEEAKVVNSLAEARNAVQVLQSQLDERRVQLDDTRTESERLRDSITEIREGGMDDSGVVKTLKRVEALRVDIDVYRERVTKTQRDIDEKLEQAKLHREAAENREELLKRTENLEKLQGESRHLLSKKEEEAQKVMMENAALEKQLDERDRLLSEMKKQLDSLPQTVVSSASGNNRDEKTSRAPRNEDREAEALAEDLDADLSLIRAELQASAAEKMKSDGLNTSAEELQAFDLDELSLVGDPVDSLDDVDVTREIDMSGVMEGDTTEIEDVDTDETPNTVDPLPLYMDMQDSFKEIDISNQDDVLYPQQFENALDDDRQGKVFPRENDTDGGENATAEMQTSAGKEVAGKEEKPRRRGRPRKVVDSSSTASPPAEKSEKIKRKPGRPRKTVSQADAETENTSTPKKRKRGRPKKTPSTGLE